MSNPPVKIGLFDFLHSINVSKTDLMEREGALKQYDPFIIRRGVAQSLDTLDYASRMNELHYIEPALQYQYLLHSIPKKKRYSKWSKRQEVDQSLNVIMEYYQVSLEKAQGYRRLLNDGQVNELRERLTGGGRGKK
ncbi:clamp loader A subunit [Vibrio phage 1.244.A._10N.261.54.C3]|nr:clamp loader A subunit [Vibrio phage 1.244.A._10N.261.54.C3]AUR98650.1 clamp loader A subunit [Vibrio phage 1.255.O._10N.286.45.F1]